jgi:hypothetical protein
VDYRNKAAHSDYKDIGSDKALRQCKDALELLAELEETRKALVEMDNEAIEPITDQSVQ